MENFLQIILKLMYCLEGSLLWQKKWESLFFGKKQPVIAEKVREMVVAVALDCHLCLEHLVSRVDKAQ